MTTLALVLISALILIAIAQGRSIFVMNRKIEDLRGTVEWLDERQRKTLREATDQLADKLLRAEAVKRGGGSL